MRLSVRDALAVAVAVLAAVSAGYGDPSFLFWGVCVGVLVGVGWPWLFGQQWREAAWLIGCAVAIPILCVPLHTSNVSSAWAWGLVLPTLGALPLAEFIASREEEPRTRNGLYLSASLPAGGAVALVFAQGGPGYGSASALPYVLMGLVALLPALGVIVTTKAAAASSGNPSTISDRLTLLALGATPGVAMTILPGNPSPVLLAAWLVVLVVWRRYAIIPLLRVTQRTRHERDLTITAIEVERARIAADLHDDALQELTALVRRLDSAGDAEGAELARGAAERLRAICSDLRLPLLDDLGAGAALEWLVARMEPMAGGAVHLERVDARRPPSGVELAVFRVAQEALANAVTHGRPPITVRYRVDDSGHVSLSVDDLGAGIEPDAAERALAAGRLGMANMQQRAEQIGALLDVRRWPAGGTHVTLEWRPE